MEVKIVGLRKNQTHNIIDFVQYDGHLSLCKSMAEQVKTVYPDYCITKNNGQKKGMKNSMSNAMKRILSLALAIVMVVGLGMPAAATGLSSEQIAWKVTVNGDSVSITPENINGEMYIPLQPILTVLEYELVWNASMEKLVAMRNGKVTQAANGENEVTVDGATVTVTDPMKIKNNTPYGNAKFLSEVFGITMETGADTIAITQTVPTYINWYDATNFSSLGTWQRSGSYLQGLGNGSTLDEAQEKDDNSEPATLKFNVPADRTYYLWVCGRDFKTNQPGDRYFNVEIDDVRSAYTFGNHTVDEADQSARDGFYWEVGGAFELKSGSHVLKMLDTSRFYSRCDGIILTADAELNPNNVTLADIVTKYDSSAMVVSSEYPLWAKGDMTQTLSTQCIENENVKVTFYQGTDADGHNWVQNEIQIKDGDGWMTVKERTEELGWMMQRAIKTNYVGVNADHGVIMGQEIGDGGDVLSVSTTNFFSSGATTWFIPKAVTVENNVATLTFDATAEAELTVTFALEGSDPKVTLDAKFLKAGAYSFLLYSGDGVNYEDFDRVTAPMLYIKKDMPEEIGVTIPDSWLFTPMSTFTYHEGKENEFTSGVVMDPSFIGVEDQYTYPDEARFGTTFRTQDGSYRNQLVAPIFGSEHSTFAENDTFSVSYRIINRNEGWFDTYKYITGDIYNLTDIRENYYTSLNETIYNTAAMMMDSVYSGWNENAMGFYNMEGSMLVSHSNPLVMVQQYLLTEDEDFLEQRTIPTLAYILSRGGAHFAYDTSVGGSTSGYAGTNGPSALQNSPVNYGTNVYSALYEMTQGRVPFFMETALEKVQTSASSSGLLSAAAMYDIARDSGNAELAETIKKSIVKQADAYLQNAIPYRMDTGIVSTFVYQDYVDPVTSFLTAYEVTGDRKYLTAAEECAQLLTTCVWTTGYQNDNATSTISLNAEDTLARETNADKSGYNFFWYGDVTWRPGESWDDNYAEENDNGSSPQELAARYEEQVKNALTEEAIPTWLVAKAGLGTEHTVTPGHANIITMSSYTGALEKLASLTGEDYFETMARSAILGRSSTYPGYYINRNIVYQMKEGWYVDGPDFTNIYWHHIPIFLWAL